MNQIPTAITLLSLIFSFSHPARAQNFAAEAQDANEIAIYTQEHAQRRGQSRILGLGQTEEVQLELDEFTLIANDFFLMIQARELNQAGQVDNVHIFMDAGIDGSVNRLITVPGDLSSFDKASAQMDCLSSVESLKTKARLADMRRRLRSSPYDKRTIFIPNHDDDTLYTVDFTTGQVEHTREGASTVQESYVIILKAVIDKL